ncbi:MAG: lysophospholipid acyltransferase family protein [Candidatus Omnitrophota bacterium]|nr:lysophospholipid acyltransferase family protein [Candidatus Omnitrophota bacterium]
MVYIFTRLLAKLVFKVLFNLKIFGRRNFPKEGPIIVASNHASFIDPVAIGIGASRKMYFMARGSLFRSRFFGKYLRLINTFPVKLKGGDINAFKMTLGKLKDKRAVLIFPEGTRSVDGNLQKPHSGIGFLQVASGASILPCYVKGSEEALPKGVKLPRFKRVSVHFGKQMRFDDRVSGHKKEKYTAIAREVMKEIGKLKENAS